METIPRADDAFLGPFDVRPMLEVRNVSRRFGGVEALTDVSLTIEEGAVVGLVGENGAGKSTLLSVLCGQLAPDAGAIMFRGDEIRLPDYITANRIGIFRAQQDQGLVENLTVAENFYLGHEKQFSKAGLLARRRMNEAASRQLEMHLDGRVAATDRVGTLPLDQRQLVEIVRAFAVAELLGIEHPIIFLDESTASLNHDEVVEFMAFIERWRGAATFVFVSHRLQEILQCSSHISVLKDGRVVGELDSAGTDEDALHSLMVGRVRDEAHYAEDMRVDEVGPPILVLDGLAAEPHFRGVSLAVHAGEIYGIGGVTGSGKSELGRAVAGDLHITNGTVEVTGRRLPPHGVQTRRGRVSYGPLDRHQEGVVVSHSIRRNVSVGCERRVARAGFVSSRAEERQGRTAIADYDIAAPNDSTKVADLSGGNQQKVMLARLVNSGSDVLVLDNPTRGVDVGARREIYQHLRRLAASGKAILVISDDLHELTGISNRVAVMKDGAVVYVFENVGSDRPTEDDVVAWMV